jgi:hypothetical protein
MVAPVGYSDISLSFSPEAFYTGIPGADVSRGMLYGQGKAEKLHMDTRLQMELTEKERQFNETLAEKIREYDESLGENIRQYDESLGFGREQFEFFQEQYEDQYGLQQDYLNLSRDRLNQNQGGSGFDMNAFLDRMDFGSGPSQEPYQQGSGTSVYHQIGGQWRSGHAPGQQEPDNQFDFNESDLDWLNDQEYGYNQF